MYARLDESQQRAEYVVADGVVEDIADFDPDAVARRRGVTLEDNPILHRVDFAVREGELVAIMVLDEPTVGLDTAGIAKINGLIRSLRTQGKAVVVITHDQKIAAQADRLVTIQDGKVHEERTWPIPSENYSPIP